MTSVRISSSLGGSAALRSSDVKTLYVFDSIAVSKLKKIKVHFEGALDHRSYDLIQRDKLTEEPKKGSNYYKHKLSNKAIDTLLNYIFSNKRK